MSAALTSADYLEFIEAIVIGLAVFRILLWPLTKHFCIQWMDCPPEPGHRGIGDVDPAIGL